MLFFIAIAKKADIQELGLVILAQFIYLNIFQQIITLSIAFTTSILDLYIIITYNSSQQYFYSSYITIDNM